MRNLLSFGRGQREVAMIWMPCRCGKQLLEEGRDLPALREKFDVRQLATAPPPIASDIPGSPASLMSVRIWLSNVTSRAPSRVRGPRRARRAKLRVALQIQSTKSQGNTKSKEPKFKTKHPASKSSWSRTFVFWISDFLGIWCL